MIHQTKHSFALKFLSCITAFFFAFSTILFSIPVQAQSINNLPLPGSMIALSKSFAPVNVKGMTINLQNPFEFDFIVHPGDTGLEGEAFKDEAYKLVKYFFASLTVPEDQLWVNLSPYEKDRIVPETFGQTEITAQMKQVIRDVIIPVIEKEVNEGEHFANLRQVFNAALLATWYKQRLKESVLGQLYVDQNKVAGIDPVKKEENEQIWNRYVDAFKQGAYDYIKEDYDPAAGDIVSKKYFSGGAAARFGQLDTTNVVAPAITDLENSAEKGQGQTWFVFHRRFTDWQQTQVIDRFLVKDGNLTGRLSSSSSVTDVIKVLENSAMLTDFSNENFKEKEVGKVTADSAELNGGINLNSAPLDMQIQRDENGFVFPKIDAAMLEQMNFQRLVPTITDIRTLEMPQLRMLLGMNPDGSEEDSDVGYEPQQAARPDEISRLN